MENASCCRLGTDGCGFAAARVCRDVVLDEVDEFQRSAKESDIGLQASLKESKSKTSCASRVVDVMRQNN